MGGYFHPNVDMAHDDVIKRKHFPRNLPFVRGIHRSSVKFPAQRPVTRSFDVFLDLRLNKRLSKLCSDLGPHRAHYDVIVMCSPSPNACLASLVSMAVIHFENV